MNRNDLQRGFRLNAWLVEPTLGRIVRGGESRTLTPAQMTLLTALAESHGEIVSRDALRARLWPGTQPRAGELTALVHELLVLLDDDPDDPSTILAAGQHGYTLTAHVEPGPPPGMQVDPDPAGSAAALTSRLDWLVTELRRRHVFKVAGAYLVAAWIILQVAQTTFQPLHLPAWWMTALTILAVIGLPVVTVLAWSYEITPTGVRLDRGGSHGVALPRPRRSLAPWLVMGVGAMAAVTGFAWWRSIDTRSDAATVGPPPSASIAVLPFVDMSPRGPAGEWLGDGLAEEMSARLAQVPGLRVAARTSAFAFKGAKVDVREIGRVLGVRHVLEGSVRRDGKQLRVTAQLVDSADGYHVWSGSYDRDWDDLLAVQGEVAGAVTEALRLVLSPEIRSRVAGRTDVNVAAIEPYLGGLALLRQSGDTSRLQDAQVRFEEALAIDPAFAHAHAGICEVAARRYERTRNPDDLSLAEQHCQAALRLDETLVETRKALAGLYMTGGQLAPAEKLYRELIASNPRDADGYIGLGRVLERAGRPQDAERELRKAVQVEPGFWGAYNALGAFLFSSGRISDAIEPYRRVTQLVPRSAAGHNNLGAAQQMAGDLDAAAESFRRSLDIEATSSAYSNLGSVYYFLGRYAEAADNYRAAAGLASENQQYWGNLGDALWQIPDRRTEARDVYRRAVQLAQRDLLAGPRDPVVMTQLAYYHDRLGEPEASQPYLEDALADGGGSPFVWYYAAAAMQTRGRSDDAARYVRKAVATGYPRRLIDADPAFKGLDLDAASQGDEAAGSQTPTVASSTNEGRKP